MKDTNSIPVPRALPHQSWESWWTELLNHDYFAEYDWYLIDWMKTPLGLLSLAAVFAGLCGWVVHPQGFTVMALLLAIIFLGVVWPWISIRGLAATLEFSTKRGREGEPLSMRLRIRNRLPWSVVGVTFRWGKDGHSADAAWASIPGWKQTVLEWSWIPPQRGEYPLKPPVLVTGFPFGFWHARIEVRCTSQVLVWPKVVSVGPMPEVTGAELHEGQVFRNKPGSAGDFLGVRPYREGDSLRRVHWPQSARFDRLMICERQTPGLPSLRITLDTHAETHLGCGPESSREWAIRLAASMCWHWLGQGAQIEFLSQGRLIAAAGGTAQQRLLMDSLARLDTRQDVPLHDMLRIPVCRVCRAACNIIITTDRGITPALLHSLRGQHPLFVVLRSAIFQDGSCHAVHTPLPVKPLIDIQLRDQLQHLARHSWKGGTCGCG